MKRILVRLTILAVLSGTYAFVANADAATPDYKCVPACIGGCPAHESCIQIKNCNCGYCYACLPVK